MLVCFNLLSNKQYVLGDYSTLLCFKLLSAKQSYVLGDCPILDITIHYFYSISYVIWDTIISLYQKYVLGDCPTLDLVELPRQCGQTNAGSKRIVNGERFATIDNCDCGWKCEKALGIALMIKSAQISSPRSSCSYCRQGHQQDSTLGRGLLLWATTTPTEV